LWNDLAIDLHVGRIILAINKITTMHLRLTFFTVFVLLICAQGIAQKIFDEGIDKSFIGGEEAFARFLGEKLRYPAEARTNGIMGLCVVAFKVDCQNKPHQFLFKTKLGFGFEDEVRRVISLTEGKWLSCDQRDSLGWKNFKIAFSINELYKSDDAFLVLTARGDVSGASDKSLLNDLEWARRKGKTEKAREILTLLIMRFPYNQDYRKQLIEISKG
jgi:hypothetical protein